MTFFADLHIHSKYSRATAKDCDLEHLAIWAQKKGITVVATGDFTHPAWAAEIEDKLVPDEGGLFKLRPDIEAKVRERVPPACQGTVRFILSVEISTIYKKGDRTRKVHHVVFAPSLEAAKRISNALARIGNIRSDGRPILGLDSRNLLEIVLDSDPGAFLIPAHIWTPWFSALGSKSGFDSIAECYGDLAQHIFAVETGLSSDPAMNWQVSSLDRYRLVSNSDAHSPQKLGREATIFDTQLDYHAIRRALAEGTGYVGTVEFFPEEGKYHADGHRKCGQRLSPDQTRERGGLCPGCGKPVTVGVLYRVRELADRAENAEKPASAGRVASLIPLSEILSELEQRGPATKGVQAVYEALLACLGPELPLLSKIPLEEIRAKSSELLAEAIARLRAGRVIREAGYDGEYGVIRLFTKDELSGAARMGRLFGNAETASHEKATATQPRKAAVRAIAPKGDALPRGGNRKGTSEKDGGILGALDPDQRRAAEIAHGPLLIVAGPGSGKTRTLAHRIAHLAEHHRVAPESCLAITFTRRAAGEMRERLTQLSPTLGERVPVHTFHSLGLQILREHGDRLGLARDFEVVENEEKRTPGALIYDELISLPTKLIASDEKLLADYRRRFPWISIDEYQDIDAAQYAFVRLLAPAGANICAIGDPDQAIYGFRGSDVGFFNRFAEDHPGAEIVVLSRNYRSISAIVGASAQVVASTRSTGMIPEAMIQSADRIVMHALPSDKAEAEFIVSTIEKLFGGHTFFSIDSGRTEAGAAMELSFSDIAVLFRTKAQAEPLREAFARSGLPFQCFATVEDAEGWDPRAERVSLLTLHAAKGLEFDVVFIAGCEDGILPLKFGSTEAAPIDEERRLFYVGMTRAKEKLFLSRAKRRLTMGSVKDMRPSPFLADIERGLVELRASAHVKRPASARKNQLDLL